MDLTTERSQLDGLMIFMAVAELRGFRAAARRLGVTPSAVSQAVRMLEARIGAPLFTRTTRSVGLTEAGETLLAHARPAVEMLSAGLDAARDLGGEVSGRLRINAPKASLPLLTNRLLPDFLDLHPRLQLELVGEDGLIDIVASGFDAGIRVGTVVHVDMVAMWLTPPEPMVIVGTPSFLDRYGAPDRPQDLQNYRCILLRQTAQMIDQWHFALEGQGVAVAVRGPLILNDAEACIHAALKSVGLFATPRSLVMHHLESGTLKTVLDSYGVEFPGLSLYYPSRSTSLPKLRAFIDFAGKRLRRAFTVHDYLRR